MYALHIMDMAILCAAAIYAARLQIRHYLRKLFRNNGVPQLSDRQRNQIHQFLSIIFAEFRIQRLPCVCFSTILIEFSKHYHVAGHCKYRTV